MSASREAMEFIDWVSTVEAEHFRAIAKYLSHDAALQFHDRVEKAKKTRETLRQEATNKGLQEAIRVEWMRQSGNWG